jgi:hypothetical protein
MLTHTVDRQLIVRDNKGLFFASGLWWKPSSLKIPSVASRRGPRVIVEWVWVAPRATAPVGFPARLFDFFFRICVCVSSAYYGNSTRRSATLLLTVSNESRAKIPRSAMDCQDCPSINALLAARDVVLRRASNAETLTSALAPSSPVVPSLGNAALVHQISRASPLLPCLNGSVSRHTVHSASFPVAPVVSPDPVFLSRRVSSVAEPFPFTLSWPFLFPLSPPLFELLDRRATHYLRWLRSLSLFLCPFLPFPILGGVFGFCLATLGPRER